MESASTNAIVNGLQQLKMATYGSLKQFDHTYSLDTYKNGLKLLESRAQVKKVVFKTGKTERYVWFLPWYEDEVKEKIQQLEEGVFGYLDILPSTSRQIREYFREKYPAYHQVAYLVLRGLVAKGRASQLTFSEGKWVTIYYLPEKRATLDELLQRALEYVNRNGYAFSQDLSNSLKVPKRLAFALLLFLSHEKKILNFKIGWSYTRNMPIFAYCREGYEAEAVARYRRLIGERRVKQRRENLVENYLSKFRCACKEMKANESVADLAASYFEQALKSRWIMGRDSRSIAWSAYFLANKILRQAITPGEIKLHARVERGKLLTASKELSDFLQLNVQDLYPNPSDYVLRIATKMKLPEKLVCSRDVRKSIQKTELLQETARFLSSLPRRALFGKRAESLAAAALYLTASHLGIDECTQRRISEAADITEVTLRNTAKLVQSLMLDNESSTVSGKSDPIVAKPKVISNSLSWKSREDPQVSFKGHRHNLSGDRTNTMSESLPSVSKRADRISYVASLAQVVTPKMEARAPERELTSSTEIVPYERIRFRVRLIDGSKIDVEREDDQYKGKFKQFMDGKRS